MFVDTSMSCSSSMVESVVIKPHLRAPTRKQAHMYQKDVWGRMTSLPGGAARWPPIEQRWWWQAIDGSFTTVSAPSWRRQNNTDTGDEIKTHVERPFRRQSTAPSFAPARADTLANRPINNHAARNRLNPSIAPCMISLTGRAREIGGRNPSELLQLTILSPPVRVIDHENIITPQAAAFHRRARQQASPASARGRRAAGAVRECRQRDIKNNSPDRLFTGIPVAS